MNEMESCYSLRTVFLSKEARGLTPVLYYVREFAISRLYNERDMRSEAELLQEICSETGLSEVLVRDLVKGDEYAFDAKAQALTAKTTQHFEDEWAAYEKGQIKIVLSRLDGL